MENYRHSTLLHDISRTELLSLISEIVSTAVNAKTGELRQITAQLRGQRPVITTGEAIAFFDFKVTERTIRQYIKKGQLKAFKQGKQWFIRVEDIYAFQTKDAV